MSNIVNQKGKKKASSNAVAHDVTAEITSMTKADLAVYEKFTAGYHADLKPRGALEEELVQILAHTQWLIHRCHAIENIILTVAFEGREFAGPGGYVYKTKDLTTIGRQEERISRKFSQTLKQLQALRKKRKHVPV